MYGPCMGVLAQAITVIEIEEIEHLFFRLLLAIAVHAKDVGPIRRGSLSHPFHQLVEGSILPHPVLTVPMSTSAIKLRSTRGRFARRRRSK